MEKDIIDKCEIFTSMDKERILAYCEAHGVTPPEDETIFWAGIHKAICQLYLLENSPITLDQCHTSCEWLKSHGFVPYISEEE